MRVHKLAGAVALGAALTLALFSGRAEAGMKVHNGLSGHNGMKVHNGLGMHNGMKVHNGATISGTWVMRTINPARSLSAAVKARR
jgi:hypothetical protein